MEKTIKSWKESYRVTINKNYKESTKKFVNNIYQENYLSIIRITLTRVSLKYLHLLSKNQVLEDLASMTYTAYSMQER
jgi:hypothetical protein